MFIPAARSEELIGEAMGPKRKPGMLIATKARFPMGEGPNDRGLSRWHLIRACEASLKRLRTDVIDLYQVHQWDGLTPLEETMEALDSLVRAGKVRYVGCSNWSGWHMMKAMEVARRDGRIPFVSEQIHYTLQAREAEYELIPVALDQKLAVLVWSPIAGGLLVGKYRRDKARRKARARWRAGASRRFATRTRCGISSTNWRRSPTPIASPARRSPWRGSRPPGGDVADHRRPHRGAIPRQSRLVNVKLTDDERARLDKVSQPPLIYPYWHQSWTAKDRLGPADLALHAPYLKG